MLTPVPLITPYARFDVTAELGRARLHRRNHIVIINFDENALAGAIFGGAYDGDLVSHAYDRETARATRVIKCNTVFGDISDAILKLDKGILTVIDAQAVAGAQILINPHSHRLHASEVVTQSGHRGNKNESNEHHISRDI